MGIDTFQGHVLDAAEFGDEANVARLKDAGALRDATADEAGQSKVELLQGPAAHATVEAKTADLQKQLAAKDERIKDLESQLSATKAKQADDLTLKANAEADKNRQPPAK
jgi:hypothetical protein